MERTVEERLRKAIQKTGRLPHFRLTVKSVINTENYKGVLVTIAAVDFGTEDVTKSRSYLVTDNELKRVTEEDILNAMAEIIKERANDNNKNEFQEMGIEE